VANAKEAAAWMELQIRLMLQARNLIIINWVFYKYIISEGYYMGGR